MESVPGGGPRKEKKGPSLSFFAECAIEKDDSGMVSEM